MRITILILLLCISSFYISGQTDSLSKKEPTELMSFDYIFSKIVENQESDSLKQIYLDLYLKKAKKRRLFYETSYGYYLKGVTVDYPKSIFYFDSVIYLAKNSKDPRFLPQVYLEYGNALYENGKYSDSFNRYNDAKKYSETENQTDIFYAANVNIAYLKEITNDYQGALEIYLENKIILSKSNQSIESVKEKLSNYHAIAYAHLKIGQLDSANYYTKIGYNLAEINGYNHYKSLFQLVAGINLFQRKEYHLANDSIIKAIPGFSENYDHVNLAYSNLYLGKIRLKNKDIENSKEFLKKADNLIVNEKRKIPLLSDIYMHLWEISKKQSNSNDELTYLTQYLEYENSLKKEFEDLYPLIKKKYDIPRLIKEKESIISNLNNKNQTQTNIFLICFFLLLNVLVFLLVQYFKNKKYRKQFEELIAKSNVEYETIEIQTDNIELGIDSTTVDLILKKLNLFEKKHEFLDSNLSLKLLSDKLQTNSSYLSKIINHHKGKGFSKYLTELRLDYIIKELILNEKLSNYTIRAIANEAGFNNPESFSKAFKEKTKIYPSYFIKRLKKERIQV